LLVPEIVSPPSYDVIIQYSTSSPTVQITLLDSCHKIFHVFHVHALKNVVWEQPTCSETALSWQHQSDKVKPKG